MNDLSLLWLPNYKQLCVNFAFGKLPTACLTLRSSAMAFSCSFQKITGTDCSFDRLDKSRSLEIVTLRNCSKDISNHYSHWPFSGVGIFREEETQGLDTICPHHRRELWLGWRRPFQQEFQVGESELCQQPLLRPERDTNVESLRHWSWEKYSLDKVRCPWTIGTADNGNQTLDQRDYHKLCSSKTQTNRWPNPCYWGRRQLRLWRSVIRWVKRACGCCEQLSIIYMFRRGMCQDV